MNPGQEQFYNYVMPLAVEGKEDTLKEIVLENFKRQDEGTATKEFMMEQGPKLIACLKEEYRDQFMKNMQHFMSTLKQ